MLHSPDFLRFYEDAASWLRPYAVFKFLQGLVGTSDHREWGPLLGTPTEALLERLSSPTAEHYGSVAFHYYLQYHLHKQLLRASTTHPIWHNRTHDTRTPPSPLSAPPRSAPQASTLRPSEWSSRATCPLGWTSAV